MSGYEYHGSEVAIVGMACRFPGANDVEEFWRLLVEGREGITFFTDEELVAAGVDPEEISQPGYVKAAPVLDGLDLFDAGYFGFTPREAELMDPQHRMFLECAVEALENAGYGAGYDAGPVGVVAGGKMSTYVFNVFSNAELAGSLTPTEIGLGNDIALLAMRASYHLNLTGPSYFVQSACSTSLVAVHLACQSLLLDECRMALAGGVAVDVPDRRGYLYRDGSIMSSDGRIRAFDAGADGTIFGCGVGALLLKRLEDAIEDGDRIYALIKGSATNNDGSAKANFTSPGVEAEARAVVAALVNAEVSPDTISYVEAHGTGTSLGDPIEIRALTRAFRTGTDRSGFCPIGTVKTNIGHVDAAAGMASLIKVSLALDREQLPPSLNFETPNPEIDFESSPFFVHTELSDWPRGERPRRAGTSGFGFGGTNAHVVLEEAPPATASGASRPWQLLVLSARSEAALERATERLGEHLREHPPATEPELADVAFTLKRGRRAFRHRRAVVCRDSETAVRALAGEEPNRLLTAVAAADERPVIFLLPGIGEHYTGMGAGLYEQEPAFREAIDRCAELATPLLGRDLRQLLYPEGARQKAEGKLDLRGLVGRGAAGSEPEELDQTRYLQPVVFAVEYALAQLWKSWGVVPQAMIGHSLGEYVAACLAGVLSLEDALKLVVERARRIDELPGGAMLAVTLSEDEIRPRLGEGLWLSAVNGRELVMVAGENDAVTALEESLREEGIVHRRLAASHAFHSGMMEPAAEALVALCRECELHAPEVPFVSNVSGRFVTDEEATDPEYWARHLCQTVRFADGLEELLSPGAVKGDPVLLEVGPGQGLRALVTQVVTGDEAQRPVVSSLHGRFEPTDDQDFLLTAAARLWLAGVEVDWKGFYAGERRHRVPLPTYPFERQRYWVDRHALAREGAPAPGRVGKIHDVGRWFHVPTWKASLPPKSSGAPAEKRRWLLFADDSELSRAVGERLADEEVLVVRAGTAYDRTGAEVVIDPGQSGDYVRLIQDFGGLPDVVVHLWNVADDDATSEPELFRRTQELGYYSLLFLAHGLAAVGADEPPPVRLVVAASRLYDLSGGEPVRPEKSTLLGPAMVIPQEQRNVSCRVVDVAPGTFPAEELAGQVLTEVTAQDDELAVAWRGRRRWVQAYEPVSLAPGEDLGRLREAGVYLLTGGLGNVGMLLAEHLAKTARARLVLLGRSAFPPREDWDEYLEKAEDGDFRAGRIRRIRAMEEAGAEVLVLAADVSDREQMRRVVDTVEQRFGVLNGVVHAAGILTGDSVYRMAPEIGREASEVQFAPKVYGLYVLEELLADRHLDFCLLISSNAAILGGLGFVAYSAANVFMDAFALDRARRNQTHWISSNWDEWPLEGERLVRTSMSELSMTREEGVDAFRRVLDAPAMGQVLVATGDLESRYDLWIRRGGEPPMTAKLHVRPQLDTQYVEPEGDLECQIAGIWQDALGIEEIGRLDNFFDIGGHSLLATQIVSRMRGPLGIELPIQTFFEKPTVAGLAEHVEMVRWAALGAQGAVADEGLEEGEI